MDHQVFAQLLGNYGEFVGAIAVVATLFYISLQVRHGRESVEANTRALDENKKVQMALAYQSRTDNISANFRVMAGSEELAATSCKVGDAGWPDPASLNHLSPAEQTRWRHWALLTYLNVDNLHYQYELGLVEADFHEQMCKGAVLRLGHAWTEMGFLSILGRPSFHELINQVTSAAQVAVPPIDDSTAGE